MENEKSLTESLIETVNENQDANFCFLVIGKEKEDGVMATSLVIGKTNLIAMSLIKALNRSPNIDEVFSRLKAMELLDSFSDFLKSTVKEDSK